MTSPTRGAQRSSRRLRAVRDPHENLSRFALAGPHLRDRAVVEDHAADQLDVEVAHLQHPLAGLAHGGERLGQERVERLALGVAAAELLGLGTQLGVAQLLVRGLEGVDLLHDVPVLLQQPVVATAEDRGEKLGQHGGSKKPSWVGARRAAKARAGSGSRDLEVRPGGGNASGAARRERTFDFISRPPG